MKLPRGFSPIKIVQRVHTGNASFRRPVDSGRWVGTVFRLDGNRILVEELETSWKVTDVCADSELEGADLEQLLKDVL